MRKEVAMNNLRRRSYKAKPRVYATLTSGVINAVNVTSSIDPDSSWVNNGGGSYSYNYMYGQISSISLSAFISYTINTNITLNFSDGTSYTGRISKFNFSNYNLSSNPIKSSYQSIKVVSSKYDNSTDSESSVSVTSEAYMSGGYNNVDYIQGDCSMNMTIGGLEDGSLSASVSGIYYELHNSSGAVLDSKFLGEQYSFSGR